MSEALYDNQGAAIWLPLWLCVFAREYACSEQLREIRYNVAIKLRYCCIDCET